MTRNFERVATITGALRRRWKTVASVIALVALSPTSALALDSTPVPTEQAGYSLPLPPIHDLDTMRWMDWKPSVPLLKVDTLLVPDGTQPGVFRIPSDDAPDLARVS